MSVTSAAALEDVDFHFPDENAPELLRHCRWRLEQLSSLQDTYAQHHQALTRRLHLELGRLVPGHKDIGKLPERGAGAAESGERRSGSFSAYHGEAPKDPFKSWAEALTERNSEPKDQSFLESGGRGDSHQGVGAFGSEAEHAAPDVGKNLSTASHVSDAFTDIHEPLAQPFRNVAPARCISSLGHVHSSAGIHPTASQGLRALVNRPGPGIKRKSTCQMNGELPGASVGQSRFGSRYLRAAPTNGFVINMTRLVEVTEILELIDEFVKSTAIAALTLVAAGSPEMLSNTALFLMATFLLFADHVYREDRLDPSDVTCIESIMPEQPAGNHNQFLASMTVAMGAFAFWRRLLLNVFLAGYLILAWIFIINRYYSDWPLEGERPQHPGEYLFGQRMDLPRRLLNDSREQILDGDGELLGAFAMQVTAFTVQYFLTAAYALILEYETSGFMPKPPDGSEAWDVTRHGVPWKFFLLGLPSMWFTDEAAQRRLHAWVDALTPEAKVHRIFPEEIAFVIMESGQEHREIIAANLKAAAFYDATAQVYDPRKRLDLDLCIFNNDMFTEEGRRGAYIDLGTGDDTQLEIVSE